ncbi:hypothetical protein SELMODRAFT_417020 [Selaginella moellendorffii]|uniref:Dirigent protein n=1 Tax=Selaginella moellendorffii TaxID=88036 RepID=D8S143_SELML|nr:hypothetical protein SELMODRAFT_417020 [Selaginella moellendorffii]
MHRLLLLLTARRPPPLPESHRYPKDPHFEFDIHDIINATEAGTPESAKLVAPATPTSPFGTLFAMDDKVTLHPSYNSSESGRVQGTYTVVSNSGTSPVLFYQMAVVLPRGKLCFFGHRPLLQAQAELSVFACGGRFKHGNALA